ncbi:hypothetical protein C8Q74DRAFT_339584 [Fomes fomentarius]|nr:hypothetical protein C8Q74DRAFT_339584 [Fomes fomentarius]
MTSAQQSSFSHRHDERFPVTSAHNVMDKTLTLSGEVVDNIVDHLYDDISSLKVCALVCHAWLPSCRYHLLYTTICFPGTPGKTHFDLIRWSQNHQEAALYVVRLCIEGTANFRELPCGSEVAVEDIELLLPLLPNLQEVVLRGVTLSSYLPADGSHIPSCCRRIRVLTVAFGATGDTTFRPLVNGTRPLETAFYFPHCAPLCESKIFTYILITLHSPAAATLAYSNCIVKRSLDGRFENWSSGCLG